MFFNKALIINPDPSVLQKKIQRLKLDIYYVASLIEEDLLDPEAGETNEELSADLKELESTLAVFMAEQEVFQAVMNYFSVQEAAEKINKGATD